MLLGIVSMRFTLISPIWLRHGYALSAIFIGLPALLLVAPLAHALEPAEAVLESLRERGHEDLAIDFLDYSQFDPLVSDAFRARIPAERISSRLALARTLDSAEERQDAIQTAAKELDKLAKAAKSDTAGAVADATGRLAIVMADESRRLAVEAKTLPEGNVRSEQMEAARKEMSAARRRLVQAQERFETEVEKLKGAPADSDSGRLRVDIKSRLAQARLVEARLLFEEAETYGRVSSKTKRMYQEASKKLAALYEKYSKWVVGLYAHLYEGQCYQRLGETALAVACYEDLTSQPSSTYDLRTLSTLAHAGLASLYLEKGNPEKSLDKPAAWLERLPVMDQRNAEAATLRYWLGRAAMAQADTLADNEGQQRRLLVQARDWLSDSSKVASDYQAEAREAWTQTMTSLGVESTQLDTFDQAYAAGKQAMATLGAMRLATQAGGADPALLEQQTKEAQQSARRAFETALQLVDSKSPEKQVGESKYLVAWLQWESGDVEQAAELAEKLARNSPDESSAEDAARLTLAALEQLSREQRDSGRLQRFADFARNRWPGSDVANSAYLVLLGHALSNQRVDQARELIASASKDLRPTLELRFQVSRWEQATQAEARQELLGPLQSAYNEAKKSKSPQISALATAALYLAQESLRSGDATRALKLLGATAHGPLTLADARRVPADSGPFRREVYRTTTWAQATAGKSFDTSLRNYETELRELNPSDTLKSRLSLAVSLRTDLERIKKDTPAKKRVAEALATTLLTIEKSLRSEAATSADWNTLVWVGQSLLKLADSNPQRGKEIYPLAAKLFAKLVERGNSERGFAPNPNAVLAAQLQGAQCALRTGKYSEAYQAFVALLKTRPAMLDVQRDTAALLQEWGRAQKDPERLEQSIAGAEPGTNKKNIVWGWAKIAAVAANAAARDPEYNDLFFEAWLNVARSRYLSARLSTGTEQEEQLRKAISTIRSMQRQYPDLGGKQSTEAYDQLLRKVQKELGLKPDGLTASQARSGARS